MNAQGRLQVNGATNGVSGGVRYPGNPGQTGQHTLTSAQTQAAYQQWSMQQARIAANGGQQGVNHHMGMMNGNAAQMGNPGANGHVMNMMNGMNMNASQHVQQMLAANAAKGAGAGGQQR